MDAAPTHTETLRHRALADPARARILDVLDRTDNPLPVDALAASTELHPNTVREHLSVLEHVGLVETTREVRTGRGRPRHLYASTLPEDQASRYKRLVRILLNAIAASDGVDARDTVRRSARADAGSPISIGDPEAVIDSLRSRLTEQGFAPRVDPDDDQAILLGACPFNELLDEDPELVCAAHLGMLEGALNTDTRDGTVSLEPFVAPGTCRVSVDR